MRDATRIGSSRFAASPSKIPAFIESFSRSWHRLPLDETNLRRAVFPPNTSSAAVSARSTNNNQKLFFAPLHFANAHNNALRKASYCSHYTYQPARSY
jgi:hypothetical protein